MEGKFLAEKGFSRFVPPLSVDDEEDFDDDELDDEFDEESDAESDEEWDEDFDAMTFERPGSIHRPFSPRPSRADGRRCWLQRLRWWFRCYSPARR